MVSSHENTILMMGDDDDNNEPTTSYQENRRPPSTQQRTSSTTNNNNNNNDNTTTNTGIKKRTTTKMKMSSCITVCMVPPTTTNDVTNNNNPLHVWDTLTRMRTKLRDPGLFRWPPHANLLYPFVDIPKSSVLTTTTTTTTTAAATTKLLNADDDDDDNDDTNNNEEECYEEQLLSFVKESFETAVEGIRPFQVHLDTFGTFGGKSRGILYLYPRSSRLQQQPQQVRDDDSVQVSIGAITINDGGARNEEEDENINDGYINDVKVEEVEVAEPLVELQSVLQRKFPQCKDNGRFIPHMTLSHFESLEEAQAAQVQFEKEEWWNNHDNNNDESSSSSTPLSSMCFTVNEIYVLKREGDGGQFKILMTVPLGRGQEEEGDDGGKAQMKNAITKSDTGGGGGNSKAVQIHETPIAFPTMPLVEENWVLEERMKLKDRRRLNSRRQRKRSKNRNITGDTNNVGRNK